MRKTRRKNQTWRRFSEEENETFSRYYMAGMPLAEIKQVMGLTRSQVIGRVSHLNLRRPKPNKVALAPVFQLSTRQKMKYSELLEFGMGHDAALKKAQGKAK